MGRIRPHILYIHFLLLALFAIGFRRIEDVLIVILFVLSIMFCCGAQHGRIKLGGEFGLLFLGMSTYYMMMCIYNSEYFGSFYFIIRYWAGPIFAYMIGSIIVNGNEENLLGILEISVFGNFLHGILNLRSSGILSVFDRHVYDYWNGQAYTATIQGTYFAPISGTLWWRFSKRKLISTITCIFILLGCIWNSVSTASRTLIVILILANVICVYFDMILNNAPRYRFIKAFKVTALVAMIIGVIYVAFQINLFSIKSAFEASNLGQRLAVLDSARKDYRLSVSFEVFKEMFLHPMGNITINISHGTWSDTYAHNLWLDIGRQTGFIPLIFLSLYTISIVKTIVKTMKNETVSIQAKGLLFAVYISFGIQFMTEPIFAAVPFMFILFCLINGAVNSISIIDHNTSDEE